MAETAVEEIKKDVKEEVKEAKQEAKQIEKEEGEEVAQEWLEKKLEEIGSRLSARLDGLEKKLDQAIQGRSLESQIESLRNDLSKLTKQNPSLTPDNSEKKEPEKKVEVVDPEKQGKEPEKKSASEGAPESKVRVKRRRI